MLHVGTDLFIYLFTSQLIYCFVINVLWREKEMSRFMATFCSCIILLLLFAFIGMLSPKKVNSMAPQMSGGMCMFNNHPTVGVIPLTPESPTMMNVDMNVDQNPDDVKIITPYPLPTHTHTHHTHTITLYTHTHTHTPYTSHHTLHSHTHIHCRPIIHCCI